MAAIDVPTLFSLAGKVALVTGGSRGIGRMIAGGYRRAEEMAGVALYLASRAGAYTNGAVIPVDGGTSIT